MNIAVIFAGGVGKRMNSKVKPKQFLEMWGKPIIVHTLEVFEKHPEIDAILVACVPGWINYLKTLISQYQLSKVRKIVPGGETGQLSIYHGLKAAEQLEAGAYRDTIVLIHDGVRPLVNEKVITENIRSVKDHGSAITTVTVTETILVVNEDNEIVDVPERKNSRLARAPQSFFLRDILHAHDRALQEGVQNYIDSCTLMQHYGHQMFLVDGPKENIKITSPEDFYTMRALLDARENTQIYGVEG
ncbi:2-C-methyl-D-erythritol 4-phosphate cytidylyltransferase [Lachnospiraceae bacterium]|nr:2-C-methyl-D-erythritol 4-phosphate cytidylyltransferase [Lachnospiraceae bacterium]